MSRLQDISIKVVPQSAAGAGPTPNALAILHEIESMLATLAAGGSANGIDLRSLPMLPGDYEFLQAFLGRGEVSAEIDALGPSQVYETAFPGVWWVSHRNADDKVMAEFIEVTSLPDILRTHPDDIEEGLDRLHSRLAQTTGASSST